MRNLNRWQPLQSMNDLDDIEVKIGFFTDTICSGLTSNGGSVRQCVNLVNHMFYDFDYTFKSRVDGASLKYPCSNPESVCIETGRLPKRIRDENRPLGVDIPDSELEHLQDSGHRRATHSVEIDVSIVGLPRGMEEILVYQSVCIDCVEGGAAPSQAID